jgi:glyoxylase-like metal-dependent hydrolase (beta-lactamase superfamily II)
MAKPFLSRLLPGLFAVGLLLLAAPPMALAAPPAQQRTQAPGFYRMALGSVEVTALYDGFIDLSPKLLKGASEQAIQSQLARNFQNNSQGMQTAVNGFLIHTTDHLILVDTGAAQCFGPTLGGIVGNLRAAGYSPEEVDTVLLTHLHADHACGLRTSDGKPAFPNAVVYAAQAEAGHWLSEKRTAAAPKEARGHFRMAQNSVAPYVTAGRFKTFAPGETLVGGLTSIAAYGHTPGHTAYLVSSSGQSLLLWGDLVHSAATQFADPEIAIEFDTNSAQAIVSRKEILNRATQEKFWVAGAHLPFPGIGHVRRDAHGYAWVPVEFGPLRSDR